MTQTSFSPAAHTKGRRIDVHWVRWLLQCASTATVLSYFYFFFDLPPSDNRDGVRASSWLPSAAAVRQRAWKWGLPLSSAGISHQSEPLSFPTRPLLVHSLIHVSASHLVSNLLMAAVGLAEGEVMVRQASLTPREDPPTPASSPLPFSHSPPKNFFHSRVFRTLASLIRPAVVFVVAAVVGGAGGEWCWCRLLCQLHRALLEHPQRLWDLRPATGLVWSGAPKGALPGWRRPRSAWARQVSQWRFEARLVGDHRACGASGGIAGWIGWNVGHWMRQVVSWERAHPQHFFVPAEIRPMGRTDLLPPRPPSLSLLQGLAMVAATAAQCLFLFAVVSSPMDLEVYTASPQFGFGWAASPAPPESVAERLMESIWWCSWEGALSLSEILRSNGSGTLQLDVFPSHAGHTGGFLVGAFLGLCFS